MQQLTVELADRSYTIDQAEGLLAQIGDLIAPLDLSERLVVVTNEVVAPLYMEKVETALSNSGYQVERVILPDGEEYKNADSLNTIYTQMLECGCDRNSTIIALGGGVIGDMAGFAAATFMRGIPFIQIPTTLLAQVDSSVGGKTAINHPLGKNMIGAFYQPLKVIIDTSTLDTLDERHFKAGLAEVVKYGVIADNDFFVWLERNISALLRKDHKALGHAVLRCCAIKADIVSRDETEQSVRALLNFGHTFGHAVEQLSGYGRVLHGEAVSIGMSVAARISFDMGYCAAEEVSRLDNLLLACGLPVNIPHEFSLDEYIQAMMRDKKVSSGIMRFVLNHGIGASKVYDLPDPQKALQKVFSHSM